MMPRNTPLYPVPPPTYAMMVPPDRYSLQGRPEAGSLWDIPILAPALLVCPPRRLTIWTIITLLLSLTIRFLASLLLDSALLDPTPHFQ